MVLISALLGSACSSQNNTFINRMYHNTTARYNAYFYANGKIKELENTIAKNHNEDFSQVLPVFYPIDSATIQQNEKLLEEVRSFASKAIDWHRISKWVDENYYLLGVADYYEAKFDDASNTFRYLNVNSKKKSIRHRSLIQLMRQYVDTKKFDDAAYVIDFLSKEKGIDRENKFMLFKTLAYFYDQREDVNGKISSLVRALEFTKDSKEKSRLNFIIAQLYQREGIDNLAYSYYMEALKGNPPYERSFFSQLYSQQVTDLNKSKDIKRVREYYEGLYKDSKNKDLKDVILFEKALFELKQDDVETAQKLLIRAAKEEGKNPIQKGYIYQKLAEISYDNNKDFRAAKYYLDSALTFFKPTDASYRQIAGQKEKLDNYVLHFETITRNDSLVRLSMLSPEEQEKVAERFIKAEEERLLKEAAAKNAPKSAGIFDNLLAFSGRGSGETFYFDNSTALQQGAIDFSRNWGNRPLQDNWRRSAQGFQSSSTITSTGPEIPTEERSTSNSEILEQIPSKESLLSQIPNSAEEIKAMNESLETAYFELGKLLYFDFEEPERSVGFLEDLITTYPNTNKKAEAYYLLFLANRDLNKNTSLFKERLNREFPDSPYTLFVNNPEAATGNFALQESSRKYKEAFDLYSQGEFESARKMVRSTLESFPLTANTDRLLLLDIMISGRIDDRERYRTRLETYLQSNAAPPLLELARNMLKALTGEDPQKALAQAEETKAEVVEDQTLAKNEEETEEEESPYKESPNQTHIFVIALSTEKAKDAKNLLAELEAFHGANFNSARLRSGNMNLSREELIFIVSPFNNAERALEYRKTFLSNFNSGSLSEQEKENSFLISIGNFQELNKRKNLEEYRNFFKKHYIK